MIQTYIDDKTTVIHYQKNMREFSQRVMQKSAKYYSITFLLLGSIASASQIHAINSINTIENQAFLPVFIAEFALNRGDYRHALSTYYNLVEHYNLPTLNERALEIALESHDLQSALNIARLWREQYPDDVPAMFYLAHLSLKANEYTLAATTLDRILQIDPNADLEGILAGIYPESAQARQSLLHELNQINMKNNPSILVLSAGLEAQNGDFENALKKVNTALRKSPNTPSFIILKANLYFAAGQPEAAFEWLKKSSQVQKKPDVGLFYAQHLIRDQQSVIALQQLDTMIKKWPKNEQMLFLAGITSIDLKKFDQAESYLKQLLRSENYQDQAHYYLGVNAERNKDIQQAIELYKGTDGNFYTVSRKNLVSLYMAQNNPADAIRLLTQERISHPHQASFLYQLQAQILKQINQTPTAIALLDEAINQMDEDAELLYTQVLLFDPYKDRERLDNALNRLLEIEPNSPTFLNAYAYTLALQNRKLDLARQYAEQALQFAPKQASILDTLGYIAFLQNDFDVAIKNLAEAYSLSPSLSIGLRYAKALYVHGEIEKFSSLCEQLAVQFPNSDDVKQLQQLLISTSHIS